MLLRSLIPLLLLGLAGCSNPSPDEVSPLLDKPVQGGAETQLLRGLALRSVARRTISGRIHGLAAGEHVLVVARGEHVVRATTRIDGIWELSQLTPGLYDVVPLHERYLFDPPSRRVSVMDSHAETIDFTATPRPQGAEDPGEDQGDAP